MSLSVEEILSHFEGVRKCGDGEWVACCPAHGDNDPSLHITMKPDGTLLLHCFSGCETKDVLESVGLKFSDLPGKGDVARPSGGYRPNVARQNDGYSRKSLSPAPAAAKPMENQDHQDYPPKNKSGLTLSEYAEYKRIPVNELMSFYVLDGCHVTKSGARIPCVDIRYFGEDGQYIRSRHRKGLKKEEKDTRFLWDDRIGVPISFYGLWRIQRDLSKRDYIVVVEGESDCHTLWNAGIQCLGIPGVSLYKPERDDEVLKTFNQVYVNIEPDHGGWTLFRRITGEDGKGGSALRDKMIFFSLTGYKDPSDAWVATNCDKESLTRILHNGCAAGARYHDFKRPGKWKEFDAKLKEAEAKRQGKYRAAAGDSQQPIGRRGSNSADYVGAAAAYIQSVMKDGYLTLLQWRNGWYEHVGNRWREIVQQDMKNRIMAFMQRQENIDAFRLKCSSGEADNIMANVASSGNCGIPQATRMPAWISKSRDGLDAGYADGLLPMANCIIDIEQAAVATAAAYDQMDVPADSQVAEYTMAITPDLLCTYAMEYQYDAGAKCPRFQEWLSQVIPIQETRDSFQMMMGLLLVPDSAYNVCFWLFGEGGTGKTTALRIIEALVGESNICHVPLAKMAERFQTWPLAEHLVNIVGEMPTDDPMGKIRAIEGDFKDSVSGEYIDCERKGKDIVRAKCTARHLFACNQLPKFYDKSNGIWDRLRIFPFNQVFRNMDNQVQNIEKTFIPDELPGIFNFALVGLAKLRALRTFPESPEMVEAKGMHRENCDIEGEYLRLYYKRTDDESSYVVQSVAFKHYKEYLQSNGFQVRSAKTLEAAIWRIFRVHPSPFSAAERQRVFRGVKALWEKESADIF